MSALTFNNFAINRKSTCPRCSPGGEMTNLATFVNPRIYAPCPFAAARMSDPTLYRMLEDGESFEAIIAELCAEKARLQVRVNELEMIAPRKLRTSDGDTLIWRCADEDIPTQQIP